MALTKKYKCVNFGGCENAKKKTVFEIPLGEKLICPVCKKDMIVEVKGIDWKKIAIIAGTIIVVVGLVLFFLRGRGNAPVPPGGGTGGGDTIQVAPQKPGIDSLAVDSGQQARQEPEDTLTPAEARPAGDGDVQEDPNPRMVVDLGYGTYTGRLKDGKPHDPNGTIVYKQAHQIEARDVHGRVAQPGDRVSGNFEDGHLINGTWFKKDGNREPLTIGGGE